MKRLIENNLDKWSDNPQKKPLLLLGARQVGKTHTIYNFGRSRYKDVVVLNFENNAPLKEIFEQDSDPSRIIFDLEKYSFKKITPEVLIFFDEIQACPKALTTLKYFAEKTPEYNIISAGSLLGVTVDRGEYSFPVGKVDRLTLYPMNFQEFLYALSETKLAEYIADSYVNNIALPQYLHKKALDLYSIYLIVGGMPEAVLEYIEKKDFEFVRIIQRKILTDYYSDMIKYSSPSESVKIHAVYASLSVQLAKENRKFKYNLIGSNARAANYEVALQWLFDAGLVYKCGKVFEGKIPLRYYVDLLSYKIYFNDVGLFNCHSNTPPFVILSGIFGGEAKGAITENYVCQQLISNDLEPFYWESLGKAELDFVLQLGVNVLPIETKSSTNTRSKSLSVFLSKYQSPMSIRISSKNFGFENDIKSVPLYAAFCIK
ncbi:MAG: ATP-binding protein [Christensenellaceae bacterium]|jgi:predicted AAA+ superfamily ATPase|nr:ATP-binding protein [Christensenellaceae bacterium]